jgi:hypothetical protein
MASLQKLDTIFEEVKQACLQLSLPPPTGVYDSQDENAQLMGSVANLAGIMVSEAFEWQQLRKPFVASGDGSRKTWDLPADFSRFVDDTGWSSAIRRPVVVLDPKQWAAISSWMSQSFTINPACRIVADQLVFMSAPPAGDQITFEYIDANWVIDADAPTTMKAKANKNGDIPRFDWLLMVLAIKLKWLEQKGMNTVAVQADFNDRLLQLTQRNQMAQTLTLSGPVPGSFRYLDNYANTPDTGLGL